MGHIRLTVTIPLCTTLIMILSHLIILLYLTISPIRMGIVASLMMSVARVLVALIHIMIMRIVFVM